LQELEGKMDETNAAAQEVRVKLQAMVGAIDSRALFDSSEARIRKTMQATLDKKFTDFLSECAVCNCNLLNPQFFFSTAIPCGNCSGQRVAWAHAVRRYTQMQEQTQIQKDVHATKVFIRPSHDKLLLCPVGRCPFLAPSHRRFMPLLSPLKSHFQVILRQTIDEILARGEHLDLIIDPFADYHRPSNKVMTLEMMFAYTSGREPKKCVLQ
jgi:hypothetical protein